MGEENFMKKLSENVVFCGFAASNNQNDKKTLIE